jgi:hypothetical protein
MRRTPRSGPRSERGERGAGGLLVAGCPCAVAVGVALGGPPKIIPLVAPSHPHWSQPLQNSPPCPNPTLVPAPPLSPKYLSLGYFNEGLDLTGTDTVMTGGYGQLVTYLYNQVAAKGGKVELNKPVTAVKYSKRDGVEVRTCALACVLGNGAVRGSRWHDDTP